MREQRMSLAVVCVASLVFAVPLFAGFAGTDVVVPLVGYGRTSAGGAGGSPVALWLTNRSASANALITVQLYEIGAAANPTATTKLVLGPGETSTVEDPLGSLFGLTGADGMLRLLSTTEVLVAIHAEAAETGSTAATGSGAGFEGIPASFSIAAGQGSSLLGVALTSSEDYRFSAVETSGSPATLRVSLRNDAGGVIASRSFDLPANGAIEHSVADLAVRPFLLASGLITVQVTAGGGSVLAYGLRTNRQSQNAAGMAMAFADSLLVSPFTAVTGLNQLKGDLTLQGSDTVTITTTPNGGGQPGGTITVDTPAYTAGTGLNLASHQFSLLAGYSLPQGCGGGQLPAWNGASWTCATDATYTAGAGLNLSGNQFSLLAGYSLPQGCGGGQLPAWNGSSWVCVNVSLPPGTAAGNTPYWDGAQWVTSSSNLFNNGSKIGIGGITNPQAQVEVGGTQGLVVRGTANSGTPLALGAGVRMQWYPRKGAFRAGMAESNWWDDDGSGSPHLALYSVGMGYQPRASGVASTAIGAYNKATGDYGLALGSYSQATGPHSIAIGTQVYATGLYDMALGSGADTNGHDGSLVIGDDTYFQTAYASCDNQITMRFTGNGGSACPVSDGCGGAAYRFWTWYPDCTSGVYMRQQQSGWVSYSSIDRKENFEPIDGEDLLAKIRGLYIAKWNYKGTDPSIKYIGPMAEDFRDAFHLNGDDSQGINTISIDGVNMAGVQALEKRTGLQQQQIAAQAAEIDALKARLAALEAKLAPAPK